MLTNHIIARSTNQLTAAATAEYQAYDNYCAHCAQFNMAPMSRGSFNLLTYSDLDVMPATVHDNIMAGFDKLN